MFFLTLGDGHKIICVPETAGSKQFRKHRRRSLAFVPNDCIGLLHMLTTSRDSDGYSQLFLGCNSGVTDVPNFCSIQWIPHTSKTEIWGSEGEESGGQTSGPPCSVLCWGNALFSQLVTCHVWWSEETYVSGLRRYQNTLPFVLCTVHSVNIRLMYCAFC